MAPGSDIVNYATFKTEQHATLVVAVRAALQSWQSPPDRLPREEMPRARAELAMMPEVVGEPPAPDESVVPE